MKLKFYKTISILLTAIFTIASTAWSAPQSCLRQMSFSDRAASAPKHRPPKKPLAAPHSAEFGTPDIERDDIRIVSPSEISGYRTMALPKGKKIVVIQANPDELTFFAEDLISKLGGQNKIVILPAAEATREKLGRETPDIVLAPYEDEERSREAIENARAVLQDLSDTVRDASRFIVWYETPKTPNLESYRENLFYLFPESVMKGKKVPAIRCYPSQNMRTDYTNTAGFLATACIARAALLCEPAKDLRYSESFSLAVMRNGEISTPEDVYILGGQEPAGLGRGVAALPFQRGGVAVFLAPHNDDLEIPAAATVSAMVDNGVDVHCAVAVSGSRAVIPGRMGADGIPVLDPKSEEDLPAPVKIGIREKESEAAARVLGIKSLRFLQLPFYDTRNIGTEDQDRMYNYLRERYGDYTQRKTQAGGKDTGPFTIFVPRGDEAHRTHRDVYELAIGALRRLQREEGADELRIVFYQVWPSRFNLYNPVLRASQVTKSALAGRSGPSFQAAVPTLEANWEIAGELALAVSRGEVAAQNLPRTSQAERFTVTEVQPSRINIDRAFQDNYAACAGTKDGYRDYVAQAAEMIRDLRFTPHPTGRQIETYEQDLIDAAELFLPVARDAALNRDTIAEYLNSLASQLGLELHIRVFMFRAFYMATSRVHVEQLQNSLKTPLKIVVTSPFYNEMSSINEEYAIDSKIRQMQWLFKGITMVEWRILFVDDGSDDGSEEAIKKVISGRYPDFAARIHTASLRQLVNANTGTDVYLTTGHGALNRIQDIEHSRRGAATLYGFRLAKQLWDADVVVDNDFDRGCALGEMGNGLWLLADGKCQAVVGCRYTEGRSIGMESYGEFHTQSEMALHQSMGPLLGLSVDTFIGGGLNMYACDDVFIDRVVNMATDTGFTYTAQILSLTMAEDRKIAGFPVTVVKSTRPSSLQRRDYFGMAVRIVYQALQLRQRGGITEKPFWDKCRTFLRQMAQQVFSVQAEVFDPTRKRRAVILAAGSKKYMDGGVEKSMVLRGVMGKPCIAHVLDRVNFFDTRPIVVVSGENEAEIKSALAQAGYDETRVEFVIQAKPLGSGDALLCAEEALKETDPTLENLDMLVCHGDVPLIDEEAMKLTNQVLRDPDCAMAMPTAITSVEHGPKGAFERDPVGNTAWYLRTEEIRHSGRDVVEAEAGMFFVKAKGALALLRSMRDKGAGVFDVTLFINELMRRGQSVTALPVLHPIGVLDVEKEANVITLEEYLKTFEPAAQEPPQVVAQLVTSILRPKAALDRPREDKGGILFQGMTESRIRAILASTPFRFLDRGDHVNVWWHPDYYFVVAIPRSREPHINARTISQYEEAKLFLSGRAVDFVVLDNVRLNSGSYTITIPRLIIRDRVLTVAEIKKLKNSPGSPDLPLDIISAAIDETVAYVVSVAPGRTDYADTTEYGIVAKDFYGGGIIRPVLFDLAWWDEDRTPPPMRLPQRDGVAPVCDI